MEQSTRNLQSTDDRLLFLTEQQKTLREGSIDWHNCQSAINHIIAQRFLKYLNS